MAIRPDDKHRLLLQTLKRKMGKALARCESSFARLPPMRASVDDYTDEELGAYDEFLARFARLTDIFLNRYLRTSIAVEDPAFSGTFRDALDFGEKIGLIDTAAEWYQIRELRNKQAHEYEEDQLIVLFAAVLAQYPRVRGVASQVSHAP